VVALESTLVDKVRAKLTSPGYGHPAHVEVATGHGPCRHCLRSFRVGEERRILFTHDPFHGLDPRPLPGPVFVHEDPCPRYPEDGGFPVDLRAHPLTLAAYGAGRVLRQEHCVDPGDSDALIAEVLASPDVAYLHVRDTRAGCYDFRIER
jgi:hypothetical protein